MIRAKRLKLPLLETPSLCIGVRNYSSDILPLINKPMNYLKQQKVAYELILEDEVYVNKIHMIGALLDWKSKGIAITGPRRMGKSITLNTLHMLKAIGISDFIKIMEIKRPGSDIYRALLGVEKYFIDTYGEDRYQQFYKIPQPVIIIQPSNAKSFHEWLDHYHTSIMFSIRILLKAHNELGKEGHYQERQAMIEKYNALIKANQVKYSLFSDQGGLIMIDEYDANLLKPGIPQSMKAFQRIEINRILAEFKQRHCIIAGVYHPKTLGFNDSQANTYSHYSEMIDPNAIAFTRKEVKRYYYQEIQEAVTNLPKKSREDLIKQIKALCQFPGAEKIKIEKDQTTKLTVDVPPPLLKYLERFNENLLADYVIDLIFFMHDGFNLSIKEVPSPQNMIVSPQVVVTVIERLSKNDQPFFKWEDYMEGGKHSYARDLLTSEDYKNLNMTSRKFLSEIITKGVATVPQTSLYPILKQNQQLPPQSILLQEGLLSVTEVKTDQNNKKHAVLKVPNYGVKEYLIDLNKDLNLTMHKLVKGFFEDLKQKTEKQRHHDLRILFKKINDQAFNYITQHLKDHSITEKNYNIYLVEFLKSVKSKKYETIEIIKELQVRNPEKVKDPKDKRISHRDILEPDITIKNHQTEQWAAIEILRNPNQTKINERKAKYGNLQDNYTTVVILAYDNEFKKLVDIQAFTPKSAQSRPESI